MSSLGGGLVGVDFLSIFVVANSRGRSAVATTFTGTDAVRELLALLFYSRIGCSTKDLLRVRDVPDNLSMNGARDTVLQLEVHLGNGVFWEYGCVRDITCEIPSQYLFPKAHL